MAVLAVAAPAASHARPLATCHGVCEWVTDRYDGLAWTSLAQRSPRTRDDRIAALRATLARGRISLEIRGGGVVTATAGCREVADRFQPGGCYRCVLAGDREATDAVLDKLTAELDRYPTKLLEKANIDTLTLCRRVDGVARGSMGGISDVDTRRVMLSVTAPEFLADIVHHELFHMIESAHNPNVNASDGQWEYTNPRGFSYGSGPSSPEARNTRPAGFVRWYAASNLLDDRASTFEYMMAQPDELCEMATKDPIIRSKVRIIWSRVQAYAGGYELLNGVAPCVHGIGWR